MSNDYPAEFEAAIRAERLKRATQLTQPVIQQITSPVSKTLQQLKDKATASELTLIEAVQAAVEENAFKTALHMVRDAASTYIMRNYHCPTEHQFKDWCIGLGKAIDSVSPKTEPQ